MNRRGFVAIQIGLVLVSTVFSSSFMTVTPVEAQSNDESTKVVIPSMKDTTALFDDITIDGFVPQDFRNQTDGPRCQLPYVELDDPAGVNIMLSARMDFRKAGTFDDGRREYSWPDQAPVLKFGLTNIPAGATIKKAQLRLTPTSPIALSGRSQRNIDNKYSNIGTVMRVSDQSILDCRWSQKPSGTGFVGGSAVGSPQQFGVDGLREGSPFGGNPRLNLPAMSIRWIEDMNLDVTSFVASAKSEANTVTFRVEPHMNLPAFLNSGVITNPGELISSPAQFWSREYGGIRPTFVPRLIVDYEFVGGQADVSGHIRLSNNSVPTEDQSNDLSQISFWRSENEGETWTQLTNSQVKAEWGPFTYSPSDAAKSNVVYKTEIKPPGGYTVTSIKSDPTCEGERTDGNRGVVWDTLSESGCKETTFYIEKGGPPIDCSAVEIVCSISGSKFEDTNGNGVRDAGENLLQDWPFSLYKVERGKDVLKKTIKTNAQGNYTFTDDDFADYGSGKYKVKEKRVPGWSITTPAQESKIFEMPAAKVVTDHIFGNKPSSSEPQITNMVKSLSDRELRGSQKNTTIRIGFRVTYNKDGSPGTIKNVVLEEKLGNSQLSYQPDGTKAKYRLVKIGGGNVAVESVASSGTTLTIDSNASGQPLELTSGDYSWEIDVTYNGGPTTGDGINADELSGAEDDDACKANKKSRAEYVTVSGDSRCIEFGQAKLTKKTAKVILNSDAWIGDKDVQIDDSLQVGNNTLLISGKTISGRTGAGSELSVANYRLPSTGKAVWQSIVDQMTQRINRVTQTNTAKELTVCPQTVTKLNLSAPKNPFTEDTISNSGSTIWRFNRACTFELPANLTIVGTGTIINPTGGRLTIRGNIQANGSSTFGYVGIVDNGGDCTGQTTNPAVTLYEGIAIKNMAIFVGGNCTNGTIRTGAQVASTCSATAPATIYEGKLISYVVEFPSTNRLCNDVLFNRSDAVAQNPPPLFDQFYVPQGRETP